MLQAQASRHQGSKLYRSCGRQCVANSVCALVTAHKIPPANWNEKIMDEVLEKGDQLYLEVHHQREITYWSTDDIPDIVDSARVRKEQVLHGTVNRLQTEKPFLTLNDALNIVLASNTSSDFASCIFTMGGQLPSYTCSIVKSYTKLFFFDPHSRSKDGMSVADGLATLTVHENLECLSLFIKQLTVSICPNAGDIPFELCKVTVSSTIFETENDSDSDWSGFSEVSEGEIECKFYLADEHVRSALAIDVSEVSDVTSVGSDPDSHCDTDETESYVFDDTVLDEALTEMNDSADFLKSFDISAFKAGTDDIADDDDCDGGDVHSPEINAKMSPPDTAACSTNATSTPDNETYVKMSNIDTTTNPDATDPGITVFVTNTSDIDLGSDQSVCESEDAADEYIVGNDDNVDGRGDDDEDSNDNGGSVDDDDTPLIKLIQNQLSKNCQSQNKAATNVADQADSCKLRSRKRVKNVEQWRRNIMKRRRNQGKEYVTKTGNLKKACTVKPGCGLKCRYKCHQHVSDSERQKLFHRFWSLGDINKQRNFICKFAFLKKKGQNKSNSQRRKHAVSYTFPIQDGSSSKVVKVCKTFFLHTLSVSERYISTSHRLMELGVCHDDQRGKHKNRPNRTTPEQESFVRSHIESFPTVESHYCRKDSKKEYLSSDLSVTRMYYLYKEKCADKSHTPVSLSVYRRIFDREYNISFHRPVKISVTSVFLSKILLKNKEQACCRSITFTWRTKN